MRGLAAAAAMIGVLASSGAAAPFEIVLVEQAGQRTLAVRDLETRAVAVASGGADLKLVDPVETDAYFQGLVERGQCGSDANAAPAPKIVIHKMDYDEDAADVRGDSQTRVRGSNRVIDDIEPRDAGAGDAERPPTERYTRLVGVDSGEAARFIDAASGLDLADAAAIKEKLGL